MPNIIKSLANKGRLSVPLSISQHLSMLTFLFFLILAFALPVHTVHAENIPWGLNISSLSANIEGYATDISINHGQTVNFKIKTSSTHYRIDIYRMGYYGGAGSQKIASIDKQLASPQVQPNPIFDSSRNLVDAGNWQVSASWAIPSSALTGIYFAKLTRLDGIAGQNLIVFIVRDDEHSSDILFQTSDTTWQAYNSWGGYNLYNFSTNPRAYAVSYNRPFDSFDSVNSFFRSEYPLVRWLDQNGYSVKYISGIDTARSGSQLLKSKIFLSAGHDEYWSGNQRANVEAARSAGVNLAFLSGNEVFWKTRWLPSIDSSNTPYRTLVSYKETHNNAKIDPSSEWTGTWRDPRFSPPADGGRPENTLTGTIYMVNSYRKDTITIPAALSKFRFWKNTSISSLQPGQTGSLANGILGYEWDEDLDNGFRPAGLINLSSTSIALDTYLLDYGSTYGAGTARHALTLYRAPSGALVFGAGTVFWSWGLDINHTTFWSGIDTTVQTDRKVEQATVNLFTDMGVQPTKLKSGLFPGQQSGDHTPPVSQITSTNQTYTVGSPATITGTATDQGGQVAVIEISTDGGATWHRADGFSNWTYQWIPSSEGNYTIKSRAVDDSVNMESPSAGITVSVRAGPSRLFSDTDTPAFFVDDSRSVELGVKFTSASAGEITGLKYYKGSNDVGTHTGSLWSSTGTLLASAPFTNETASGWQTVTFTTPVQVTAGTTYVASYHSNGFFSDTFNYFATTHTSGLLSAPSSAGSGGNGVYKYGSSSVFPTDTYNESNYWVDVLLRH